MAMNPTSTASGNLTGQQVSMAHPTFTTLRPIWTLLRDVRWGSGGFLDASYLVAHPREWKDFTATTPKNPTKKLAARRALASYENFGATILEALKTALFREQATRRLGTGSTDGQKQAPIEEWWDDVDGAGTQIDDFMAMVWDVVGTFGHAHVYLDRTSPAGYEMAPADGQATAADQQRPFLRAYTPLDALDWRINDLGQLTAIKFQELAPQPSITEAYLPQVQVRVIDQKEWKLYDKTGRLSDSGDHGMGCLPVVTIYATRQWEPGIGSSVLGDPKLYIDVYNLVSEVRELLRNQTFGILNIPLGTGPDAMTVEQAMTLIGNAKGTENALFSGLAAGFIQPDAANVEVYHAELTRKLRAIYRLASVSWESDSKDAEASGSLKLKREEMNQRLSGYADELERADYLIAEMFYRATEGADIGPKKMETDEVSVKYPDNFDMTPFDTVLQQAQAAQNLGMPTEFLKELRKRLVRKFDGMADLPPDILDAIDAAIDSAPDDLTPDEKAQQRLDGMAQALKGGGLKKVPKPVAKGAAA